MDEGRCGIGLDEHHGSLQFPTSAVMGSSGAVHCCQVYDFDSVDRASYSSSPDDADPSTSPIDLICERELRAVAASSSSDDEPSPLGWPLARQQRSKLRMSPATPAEKSLNFGMPVSQVVMPSSPTSAGSSDAWTNKRGKKQTSELEMMKERFSKLLLGEDMSGSGKGVCTALAISNAITNLAASVFGELWKLEPLSLERKAMWNREMDWLLSVCDHIVEFVPSFHSVSDGSSLEVMISRPRSDLHINLPALRKLDAMLLEALDSFKETDFWYVDQGVSVVEDGPQRNQSKEDVISSTKRQEDKWWLPVPKIPPGGLSEKSRKALQYQRDCNSQILKAAMAINEQVLSEMQVPDVYWESLPKSARSCLGERIYYGLGVEHFSPDALLSSLDLSTEHNGLEVANRIQSAVHVWRKKAPACYLGQNKGPTSPRHHRDGSKAASSRYPWSKVKELVAECDSDKRMVLIERAESLLLCLRQRFPGLPQTVLDVNKIQYNKDVGQAILESYSRVLESLAFSILSRIDDVLYIADMTKRNGGGVALRGSRKLVATVACVSHGTPFATPYASPGSDSSASSSSLSPSPLRQVNATATTATATATTEPNSVCPSFLSSLCSATDGDDGVKEAKKPKERPWIDIEHRRSFYSPPGRD